MAPASWSNLHPDILSMLTKILNTDVDILRLRSVCSSWRYALPPRLRPSPFPLKVPPLWNCAIRSRCAGGRYLLNYTTLYRLSPPEIGPRAGDTSDGWLFRVLEVNPNCFTLLSPLVPIKAIYPPSTVPDSLNLLDYRITEICKCYNLTFVNSHGFPTDTLATIVGKVVVVSNDDFGFVVIVSFVDGTATCWKYGHEDWTPIDTLGYGISDVVVSNGKCYAVSDEGVLFLFDSNLELTVVHMPGLPVSFFRTITYLLEYKSDLYLALRIYEEINRDDDDDDDDESSDEDDSSDDEEVRAAVPFRLEIFKKCNNTWKHVECLRDELFFSSEDVSIGLPAEDFKSSKGNSVYVAITNFVNHVFYKKMITYFGVYDVAEATTASMKLVKDKTFMSWPPPTWLSSSS